MHIYWKMMERCVSMCNRIPETKIPRNICKQRETLRQGRRKYEFLVVHANVSCM